MKRLLSSLVIASIMLVPLAKAQDTPSRIANEQAGPHTNARKPLVSNFFLNPAGTACEAPVGPGQSKAGRKAAGPPMVRIAYIIPSNRAPQPNGVAALQNAITIGRQWFSKQMQQNGFEPRTFRVETEADGLTPTVHVVHVPEADSVLRGNGGLDVWDRTIEAAERAGVSTWAQGEVWLLVPEAHVMQADGSVRGGAALGASHGSNDDAGVAVVGSDGLAMLGAGYLTDDRPPEGLVFPELGPYPYKQDVTFAWFLGNTVSMVSSSMLGSLLHELGHALGLAHDFRNDNNFHGNLMGNGLRGIRGNVYPDAYPEDYSRLTYAEAQFLTTSAYFNDGMLRNDPPLLNLHTLPGGGTPQNGHLRVEFTASDPDGLAHAWLAFGGNLIDEMALSETSASATFTTPYHKRDGESEYALAVFDRHGNKKTVWLTVTADLAANWAPQPFIQTSPAIPAAGSPLHLFASQSNDPDHDAAALRVEWDLNNDGLFDTAPAPPENPLTHSLAGGDHLLRIRVTDPAGAQTVSTPVSVHVRQTAPEEAALISPADGSLNVPLDSTVLRWAPAARATSYDYQVAINEAFTDVTHQGAQDSTTVSISLAPGTTYYWRVRAANTGGTSDWSPTWRFTTEAARITGTLTFQVDLNREIRLGHVPAGEIVGLRGDTTPLSWTATTPLGDPDGDGIFSAQVDFTLVPATPLAYQFVHHKADGSGLVWEYGTQSSNTRTLTFNGDEALPLAYWNDVTGIATEDEAGMPTVFALHQNYPNPFNPTTEIAFDLPRSSHVRLSVFDLLGREVAVLLNRPVVAGRHMAVFEAEALPGGIYLYRLQANGFSETRQLILIK